MRRVYPELGKCLCSELGSGTQSGFYELLNRRLNWICYVNQPEPDLKAWKVWALELGKVMKVTKCCSPDNTSWTEKHKHVNIRCSSLMKMCGEVRSGEFFFLALEEYHSILRPVTTKQVLPSQQLGRIKQGLTLPGRDSFSPKTASSQECQELQQKTMPFFAEIPSVLVDSAQCSA
ncbi:hypothetical protein Pint_12712 [Pistacia integerrima]|uniref:Uncharacterized protein n=1 Tax=Pistacia integerrima TaxID=434235 RepID=A0ACC0Y9T3_9ROSI|nr:hypothetical protein Pint_12712 [Pistacia integerrima]